MMLFRSFTSSILVVAALCVQSSWAWSPLTVFGESVTSKAVHSNIDLPSSSKEKEDLSDSSTAPSSSSLFESRRNMLAAAAMQICLLGGAATAITPSPVIAAEPTLYKSGKAPVIPGQKPKDKNDLKGTRKDPDFLRSIADCKNQCQSTNGPDGLAKAKEDCLSECQDICCTTYEQCTFNIVPRL